MNFAQGGILAVVNTTDLIALLVSHPKNKSLQRETATAYVQRETGAVGGIARAVQAATAPTEGPICRFAQVHVKSKEQMQVHVQ